MKVVALISGGKDSIFNLLHCLINGHTIVALGNLRPVETSDKDDIDSFMYQTVGYNAIAAVAQALNVPLYTRSITGNSLNTDLSYEETARDETEDLHALLQEILTEHPGIQGLSSGAILSNYQRIRVEHVAGRLGLTCLSYLWERNQKELLQEMIDAGMESVLVKVAGAGLKTIHLGRSLAQMQSTLLHLNGIYDLHPCGEGGEYETLTVDSPVFSKRIRILEQDIVTVNEDPFFTVAYLHLKEWVLDEKDMDFDLDLANPSVEALQYLENSVAVPPLLDDKSETLKEYLASRKEELESAVLSDVDVIASRLDSSLTLNSPRDAHTSSIPLSNSNIVPCTSEARDFTYVSNVTALNSPTDVDLPTEMRLAFEHLIALITPLGLNLKNISHISLYISPLAMASFADINKVYQSFFQACPPTRACVAVSLPEIPGSRLVIEATVQNTIKNRTSLHVQGLSYWAAANIGPYSQAICTPTKMFVSGQIPLIPRDLTLPSPSNPHLKASDVDDLFAFEVALSLQHLSRIVASSQPSAVSASCDGGVCWLTEGPDWDIKASRVIDAWYRKKIPYSGDLVCISATVLPKNAPIEWQLTFTLHQNEDSDDEEKAPEPVTLVVAYNVGQDFPELNCSSWHAVKLFYKTKISPSSLDLSFLDTHSCSVSYIPTQHISTAQGSFDVAFIIEGYRGKVLRPWVA